MKAKVTKITKMGVGRTATLSGKFKGKNIEIYLSNTNTSWSDMNGDKLVVDSEVDIDDDAISLSNAGRYFIARLTFDTEEKILKGMELAQRKKALGF